MKKTPGYILISLAFMFLAFHQTINAQDTTHTIAKKEYKNTIHLNLTNPLIFGTRNIILGYERVVNKHQSFTVNFGLASFPDMGIINDDSLQAKRVTEQKGFNFSVDYRFYLARENKYGAPRGIYIGPYYSHNYFGRKHTWTLISTDGGQPIDVETETSLRFNTLGFQMGYQFVFWNRLSLDLVLIGPGFANYDLKAELNSDVSAADKLKFFLKLNQALTEKFPGYTWAIDEDSFQKNGSANTTNFGYRYLVQVGFRF